MGSQVVHVEEEAGKQEAASPDAAHRKTKVTTTTATVRQYIEIAVLSVVIVIVWGLLALPTVFYITEPSQVNY